VIVTLNDGPRAAKSWPAGRRLANGYHWHRLSLLSQDRETWKMIIENEVDTFVPMDHDDEN